MDAVSQPPKRRALVGAVAPVAVRRIVPGRVGIAVRVGVVRVRRVSVVRKTEREAKDETAAESSTVAEEETVVAEIVEASREATEVASAELPAEATPGEVPRPELTATKMSTEVSGMPATEVPTAKGATHVSPAEATTPVASCK